MDQRMVSMSQGGDCETGEGGFGPGEEQWTSSEGGYGPGETHCGSGEGSYGSEDGIHGPGGDCETGEDLYVPGEDLYGSGRVAMGQGSTTVGQGTGRVAMGLERTTVDQGRTSMGQGVSMGQGGPLWAMEASYGPDKPHCGPGRELKGSYRPARRVAMDQIRLFF